MDTNIKSIFLSKTAWLAAGTFLVGLLLLIQNTFPNESWVSYVVMAKAVVDLLLRLNTSVPVSISAPVIPPKPVV